MQNLIFKSNNHSKYLIEWQRVTPEVCDNISKLIFSHYEIKNLKKSGIYQVKEWEKMSNNFKVKALSDGKWKNFLFRKHIQLKEKESISILDKIFDYLNKKEIPVPRILKTKDKKTSFCDGGNFYVMYEFIEGNHYSGTLKELKEVAKGLACLHQVLKKIPFMQEIEKKPSLLSPWSKKEWKEVFTKAKKNNSDIDQKLNDNQKIILETIEAVEENFKEMISVRIQPIHCDLHPQNTIFNKEKLVAILDFEGVRLGEICRDVGNACHRFVRQFVVFQKKDWHKTLPEGWKIFIKEYTKLNSLTQDEISLMPVFIQDELLRKLLKDLKLHYFKNYSRNIEGGELEKKLNLLKEANIISNFLQK